METISQTSELIEAPQNGTFEWRHVIRPILRSLEGPEANNNSQNSRLITVDMKQTVSLDTAALGMLLQLEDRLKQDPQRFRLINVHPELRSLIEVAGLANYLR